MSRKLEEQPGSEEGFLNVLFASFNYFWFIVSLLLLFFKEFDHKEQAKVQMFYFQPTWRKHQDILFYSGWKNFFFFQWIVSPLQSEPQRTILSLKHKQGHNEVNSEKVKLLKAVMTEETQLPHIVSSSCCFPEIWNTTWALGLLCCTRWKKKRREGKLHLHPIKRLN